MLVEKRQQMILKMLEERNSVTVNEIKDSLGISESTIRRDLTMLDKENKLIKVFGGAIAVNSNYTAKELSVSQKLRVNEKEKRQIARKAAELIKPTDFVYLDAGTTTGYMIEYKLKRSNICYKCSCTRKKTCCIGISCNTCWR